LRTLLAPSCLFLFFTSSKLLGTSSPFNSSHDQNS
jgi:hypothetical protein